MPTMKNLTCMARPYSSKQIKLLLFDLGGVLVELGESLFPSSWILDGGKFELEDWFSSQTAIKFETGKISKYKFIDELKRDLNIKASTDQVLAAFTRWPQGLFPGTNDLLAELRVDYELAVLSNTNQIHEPILLNDFGLQDKFDYIFFSHLISCSKPNPQAFNHVLKALDLEPSEVLFFDDRWVNVQAAQNLGIRSFEVFSPRQIWQILKKQPL